MRYLTVLFLAFLSPALAHAESTAFRDLTDAQRKSVDEFISAHEQSTGDLIILADRRQITVNTSKALHELLRLTASC